mmetsp:Transcript_9248/g.20235  ORF Transcript_9248/g.20235 Transcript_9248/m.20235 type:complete len:409 (+) Transcript_9248:225-1451(+)
MTNLQPLEPSCRPHGICLARISRNVWWPARRSTSQKSCRSIPESHVELVFFGDHKVGVWKETNLRPFSDAEELLRQTKPSAKLLEALEEAKSWLSADEFVQCEIQTVFSSPEPSHTPQPMQAAKKWRVADAESLAWSRESTVDGSSIRDSGYGSRHKPFEHLEKRGLMVSALTHKTLAKSAMPAAPELREGSLASCARDLGFVPRVDARFESGMLRVGCHVAIAVVNHLGRMEWYLGRVRKMKSRAFEGAALSSKYITINTPMPFQTARTAEVKVVCDWYTRHRDDVFTFDGAEDLAEYSTEAALALVLLKETPVSICGIEGKRTFCFADAAQGRWLDDALRGCLLPDAPAGSPTDGAGRGQAQLVRARKRKTASASKSRDFDKMDKVARLEVGRAAGKRRATAVALS